MSRLWSSVSTRGVARCTHADRRRGAHDWSGRASGRQTRSDARSGSRGAASRDAGSVAAGPHHNADRAACRSRGARGYTRATSCSATSRSKDRSASARRRSPSGSPRGSMRRSCSRNRESVPRRLLRRPAGRGAAGAALLSAQPPSAADGAAAGRSLQPADGLRLPVRQGQDLRVPEPRRQRAVHLPAALRSARARRAAARSRDLPAGADRRPAARARAAGATDADVERIVPDDRVPARAERGVPPLLLPLHAPPAARRRNLAVRLRRRATTRSTIWSDRSTRWARARATTCRGRGVALASRHALDFLDLSPANLLSSPVMAWFKKTRKPIASPPGERPAACPKACGSSVPAARRSSTTRTSRPTCSVCPKCAHHFRISAAERLRMLFDGARTSSTTKAWPRPTRCSSPTPSRTASACESTRAGHRRSRTRSSSPPGDIDGISRASSRRWSTPSSAAAWAWSSARRSRARIERAHRAAPAGGHRLAARAARA